MADVPTDAVGTDQALLNVTRAIAALRRGQPARVTGADGSALLVAAAETIDAGWLDRFAADPAAPPWVLTSPARAAEITRQAVPGDVAGKGAVALRPALEPLDLAGLRTLADPTLPPAYPAMRADAAPAEAAAVLSLLKQAGLLPTALAVPFRGQTGADSPAADAGDILGYTAHSAAALMRVSAATVPIGRMADCRMVVFRAPGTGRDHLAILLGRPEDVAEPLVRVHSECFTGDLLGSLRCDCGAQLQGAIERIAAEGAGAVLYLAQEGRGIGMANKLRAYALQDRGLDTLDANQALGFAADERDFAVAAAMLRQLGLLRIRLLTNNPGKIAALAQHGIDVAGRVSLRFAANGVNDAYLATKAARFGHMLDAPEEP